MPVSDYEHSRNKGNPAELFEFKYGVGEDQVYAYTNADSQMTFGSLIYEPIPISHESIKSKGRGEAVETKITVPADSEIADLFKGFAPRRIITVRILKGHVTTPDDPGLWRAGSAGGVFQPHWYGRVTEQTRNRAETVLTCSTLGAGMRRPALGMFYQRSCQHLLYGPRCRADKAAATRAVTLDTTTNAGVRLDAGWEGPNTPSSYVGGTLEWIGDYGPEVVSILGASVNGLRTDAPVRDIAPGHAMTVSLGCGHTMNDCRTRFDNIINFGGHPFIPLKNPVNKNNHT